MPVFSVMREEGSDLDLPSLSHFLNLLIQRRSCSLGRKSQKKSCNRCMAKRGALCSDTAAPASGLTLLRRWRSVSAQAPSPPASASPKTKAALKSPPVGPRRLGPRARSGSCYNTSEQRLQDGQTGARRPRPRPSAMQPDRTRPDSTQRGPTQRDPIRTGPRTSQSGPAHPRPRQEILPGPTSSSSESPDSGS